ncbi:unnamed protein product [Calypogeia fissa]
MGLSSFEVKKMLIIEMGLTFRNSVLLIHFYFAVFQAIKILNMIKLHGKPIRVNKASQDKKSLDVGANLFVGNLDLVKCRVVRRIDVNVKNIYWSDSGDLVAIASDSSFYVLKYNRDIVSSYLDSGKPVDEQVVEDAFELLHEISERIQTGVWVGDCFIYNNSAWRLNYVVGGEVTTMFHLDRPMYLLGYLASQSHVYLIDKEFK